MAALGQSSTYSGTSYTRTTKEALVEKTSKFQQLQKEKEGFFLCQKGDWSGCEKMAAVLKNIEKGSKLKNEKNSLKVLWEEVNQRLSSQQG